MTNVPSMICTSISLPLPRVSNGTGADLGERQRSLPIVVPPAEGQPVSSRGLIERPLVLMATVLQTLSESNAAQRTELNWQAQNEVHCSGLHLLVARPWVCAYQWEGKTVRIESVAASEQALMDARQLVSQHPDVVAQQGYALVAAVMPAVEALRSQTARNALILLQVAVLRCC